MATPEQVKDLLVRTHAAQLAASRLGDVIEQTLDHVPHSLSMAVSYLEDLDSNLTDALEHAIRAEIKAASTEPAA